MEYHLFLLLTLLLSVPFYVWGAIAPVDGLPFGLPISFLMIFVPFGLAIAYAWARQRGPGVLHLFNSIFDLRKSQPWAALLCVFCMPAAVMFSYFTMLLWSFPLPQPVSFPVNHVPAMFLLYFLGAIPEEFGWTMTLTRPLTDRHGPIGAGVLIGLVWAVWHVVPWSWAHDATWISGMIVLNVLMRIGMVLAFTQGGGSLFYAVVFHAMINVSMGVFPNSGSHTNPWIISGWVSLLLALAHLLRRQPSAVKG